MPSQNTDIHAELFEKAKKVIPGGVHSAVRCFKNLPMSPRFIKSANGAYMIDVEDRDYIDFCNSFGPMILGHRNPQVEEEILNAVKRGWSFGACEPYSLDLSEYLVDNIPHIDSVRFVNSGTEAVMTAVRLARGFTGKNKVIKFDGCYHGHLDSMLIKAGSGLAGEAEASSAGVPEGTAQDTLIVPLDDLNALEQCFRDHEGQVASVVMEPLPANNGLLIQDPEYLEGVRKLCDKYNSLLIFDEVISGFRVAFGGMPEKTGITPDIVTYGKVVGGGMPVGAVGAREEIMKCLSPTGPVYQAGTLSANPLAMVAGLSTLKQLTKEAYSELENNKERVVSLFRRWLDEFAGGKFAETQIVQTDSLFWMVPGNPPKKAEDIPADQAEKFAPIFTELLNRGIYIAPAAFEVGFISLAHDESLTNELEKRLFS